MMQHFCSISKNPGKTGEYFYSSFFRHYAVSADYRALGVQDLVPWIDSGEWEKYEGISVSMPFKSQIVEYLDSMDDIVKDFGSSNTVKIGESFGVVLIRIFMEYLLCVKLFQMEQVFKYWAMVRCLKDFKSY